MNRFLKVYTGIAVALALAAVMTLAMPGNAGAQLTAKANHDHITIDFFYHGSTVSVKGMSDPDADLVIKIASPEHHEALKKRGKVSGVLWMNVGDLKYEAVPNFYYVRSSKELSQMLSPEEMEKYGLGYEAVKDHAVVTPVADEAEKTRWFDEFVKYKESAKLYSASAGRIDLTPGGGEYTYCTLFDWPYQAPPGDYTVSVYAVKDGKVLEQAASKVNVAQVGMVKRLAEMAKDRGGLYGVLSILAALGAGFGVGMIFKKGGGAH